MGDSDLIAVGKIGAAVGLRGEVKVLPYSGDPTRFVSGAALILDGTRIIVKEARLVKNKPVLSFEGVNDRTRAEALRGRELFVRVEELPSLPEDSYYIRDLTGCSVVGEDGTGLGVIGGVIQNGAQDLYEIITPEGKTFLLPAVAEFVLSVNTDEKRVDARLPEGLLELGI